MEIINMTRQSFMFRTNMFWLLALSEKRCLSKAKSINQKSNERHNTGRTHMMSVLLFQYFPSNLCSDDI